MKIPLYVMPLAITGSGHTFETETTRNIVIQSRYALLEMGWRDIPQAVLPMSIVSSWPRNLKRLVVSQLSSYFDARTYLIIQVENQT